MAKKARPRVIALEEHYWDAELAGTYTRGEGMGRNEVIQKLHDLGDIRVKEMDEAGIDVQVLSHGGSGTQSLEASRSVDMAPRVNDRLHEFVRDHADRFAAFAVIPTPDPKAAADELERCVTKLGFKGAMTHGLSNGEFLDQKKYWPIYERAAALDVPIYVHPATPHQGVIDLYYKDYVEEFPAIFSAGMGYTFETAVQGLRLVCSGVFDKYPDLKIILGHLGEGLPYLQWRIDHVLRRKGDPDFSFRKIFSEHFYVTTSGFFSDPAVLCAIMELGIDHVLFSVDYPWVDNKPGVDWIDHLAIADSDKEKMLHGNAERLLKM